jgi:membrane protease YdiL (CAAX protease family)
MPLVSFFLWIVTSAVHEKIAGQPEAGAFGPKEMALLYLPFGLTQLLFALGAPLVAHDRIVTRLRLHRSMSRSTMLLVLVTPLITALGMGAQVWLLPGSNAVIDALVRPVQGAHGLGALLLIIVVAVLAPISDELFFRGYVQSRLEQRLTAWIAIVVPATVWSMLHLAPSHIVAVFPFAVWVGWVASRTESTLPAIACHVYNNALLLVLATSSSADLFKGASGMVFLSACGFALAALAFLLFANHSKPEVHAESTRPPR